MVAHLHFPGRGVDLFGVLDVHKGSGFDDAKVREISFLAVKHLEWRLLSEYTDYTEPRKNHNS